MLTKEESQRSLWVVSFKGKITTSTMASESTNSAISFPLRNLKGQLKFLGLNQQFLRIDRTSIWDQNHYFQTTQSTTDLGRQSPTIRPGISLIWLQWRTLTIQTRSWRKYTSKKFLTKLSTSRSSLSKISNLTLRTFFTPWRSLKLGRFTLFWSKMMKITSCAWAERRTYRLQKESKISKSRVRIL